MKEGKLIYYYGIDLLKIIAMMMITGHHVLGHGGILASAHGVNYGIACFMETMCYCGVDCYALISGFLCYGRKRRLSRYLTLWMQTVFYCLIITLIFKVTMLDTVGISDIVKSALPVTFNQYWYFSAYTGMFLLMPILNMFAEKLNTPSTKRMLLLCFLIFSCYATICSRWSDPFKLNGGYSCVWLSILYFIGAVVRKYELQKRVDKRKIMAGILGLVLFTWIWKISIGPMLGHGLDGLFLSYTSPTVLGIAVGMLLVFSNKNLKHGKITRFIASSTFGVYLLQDQGLFSKNILTDKLAFIAELNPGMMVLSVTGCILLLFTCGILMDKIRAFLFKVFKINSLALAAEKAEKGLTEKLIN